MLIGRSRRCEVTLKSSSLVSRRHCRIDARDSGYFLRDLDSQNGTWVDGQRIDHAFLQDGDRFVVGDVILRIRRGEIEVEGTADPRSVHDRPKLRDQRPALLLISLPVLSGVLLLALAGRDRGPLGADESETLRRMAKEIAAALVVEETTSPPLDSSVVAALDPSATATEVAVALPVDPSRKPYTLEELLTIAATVDRVLAAREAEMEALLENPESELERAIAGGEIAPRPLEESWSQIAGDAPPVPAGKPSNRLAVTSSPPPPRLHPRLVPAATRPTRGSDHTDVAKVSPPPDPAPLFPEGARADLARAIVDEGIGLIDRYHVRDVSYVPLRPLIVRLRDLDGLPAAHGLLELRAHNHEQLRKVYRRSQKLSREASRAGKDLTSRPKGGADEREDELTLRLAEMVEEHLGTLVLIRDELEGALLAAGNPVSIVEALQVAFDTKEADFFEKASTAATLNRTWPAVPVLIEAVGSAEASIRRTSRESLETITGERPGTSRSAWREWWRARVDQKEA